MTDDLEEAERQRLEDQLREAGIDAPGVRFENVRYKRVTLSTPWMGMGPTTVTFEYEP